MKFSVFRRPSCPPGARLAMLCGALWGATLAATASAQSLGLADPSPWSGFGPAQGDPRRAQPWTERQLQDIRHEGPWSRTGLERLDAASVRLFALLDARQWSEALAWIKEARPDLDKADDSRRTALTMAVPSGRIDLVREMLAQGADIDRVGAGGMTPLGGAVVAGQETMVRDLLRRGARLDVPGATGQLPLHLACATGQVRLVRLLIAHGADWRLPNRKGRHAVAEAAYFGHIPVLQALKASGADLSAPDRYALNAVHAAALGEQRATLAWLEDQGVAAPSAVTRLLIERLDATAPQPAAP